MTQVRREAAPVRKIFLSFDFDKDRALKDLMLGQAKHVRSPFEVSDHSLKEEAPQPEWRERARAAIARSDVVVVLLGPHTKHAPGVLAEVAMARELDTPMFQVFHSKGSKSWAVPDAGPVCEWSWANLKEQLA